MKITKTRLRKIIRESFEDYSQKFDKAYKKGDGSYSGGPDMPGSGGSLLDLEDYEDLYDVVDRVVAQHAKDGYTREDIIAALQNIIEEL